MQQSAVVLVLFIQDAVAMKIGSKQEKIARNDAWMVVMLIDISFY